MLKSKNFSTSKRLESLDLVELRVGDLGFLGGATTQDIYYRARKLGLQLCPAEVGPHYRLTHLDQTLNAWKYIAMEPITGSDGGPGVFRVGRSADGLWLGDYWAYPGIRWDAGGRFVFFRSRK